MVDKITHALQLALDAINGIPSHSWYIFGVCLGLGILTSIATAIVTYYHKYKTAGEKYTKAVIGWLLHLMTGTGTLVAFFLTNSHSFLPFLGAAYPTIYAASQAFYQFIGSKIYQSVAQSLSAWANQKNTPKASIFTTTPSHAPADQTGELDDIFS